MEKYLFEVNLSLDGKTLRTKDSLIVGNFLGKYIDVAENTPKEEIIREAERIKDCILTLNDKVEVEITVRYFSTTSSVWEGLYLIKNNTIITL